MSTTAPEHVAPTEGIAVVKQRAEQKQKGGFFSVFYLPSSQSYDEDLHLATSSYVPFQGAASAASAVMGGILSVLDTAIAVMNDEFDTLSESIVSDRVDDEDGLRDRGSCMTSESNVMRCCRKTERSLTSADDNDRASTANEDASRENSERSANYESERNVHSMSIEHGDSQEKDYFTPQNSLIGSISMLQLYEEGSPGDAMKPLISDQNSMSNGRKDETVFTDLMSMEPDMREKEDHEYCIVRNESETNDGWLVVSDD